MDVSGCFSRVLGPSARNCRQIRQGAHSACALRNSKMQVLQMLFGFLLQCSVKNAAMQERGEAGWGER
jgi:hypothetical protein